MIMMVMLWINFQKYPFSVIKEEYIQTIYHSFLGSMYTIYHSKKIRIYTIAIAETTIASILYIINERERESLLRKNYSYPCTSLTMDPTSTEVRSNSWSPPQWFCWTKASEDMRPMYIFQTRPCAYISIPFHNASDTTPSISTSKTTLLHHQYSISQNRFSSMLTWFCCRSNKPRGKPTATILSLFIPTTIIKVIRVAQRVISETTWFWLSLSLPP